MESWQQMAELMDVEKLREWGLTAGEIKVARALFVGQSVVSYAAAAGITLNTARWYTKQIYRKAGVHRQTELIYELLKKRAGGVGSG
jgi:DNA-binding CsgD family transcriptional regulator